jgi:hypothetical protein
MTLLSNLLLGLGLLAMTQFCVAQTSAAPNILPTQQHCAKVYWAKITLPDGTSARIKTREGEMGTITFSPEGRGIGITPSTLDTRPGRVRLQISNITAAADKQTVATHGAFVLVEEQGEATYAHGDLNFKIEMLPAAPTKSSDKPCNANELTGKCCVKCDNTTACGIEVQMDCGSCCSDC